jgi:hypothetical protein
MASTPTRNPRLRSHLLRTLALSLGAIAIVGLTDIAPANAWYDAYGYWHPNHGYYYHHAYWRHHRWCEYHPGACGYRHYGYYGYDRY